MPHHIMKTEKVRSSWTNQAWKLESSQKMKLVDRQVASDRHCIRYTDHPYLNVNIPFMIYGTFARGGRFLRILAILEKERQCRGPDYFIVKLLVVNIMGRSRALSLDWSQYLLSIVAIELNEIRKESIFLARLSQKKLPFTTEE